MAAMNDRIVAGYFYDRLDAMREEIMNVKDIRELKEYFSNCSIEFDEYSDFLFVYNKIKYASDPAGYQGTSSPFSAGSAFQQLAGIFNAIVVKLNEIGNQERSA